MYAELGHFEIGMRTLGELLELDYEEFDKTMSFRGNDSEPNGWNLLLRTGKRKGLSDRQFQSVLDRSQLLVY